MNADHGGFSRGASWPPWECLSVGIGRIGTGQRRDQIVIEYGNLSEASSHDSTGGGHLESNLDTGGPAGRVRAAMNDPFAFKGLPQKLNAWQPLRTRDCVMTASDCPGMLGGLAPSSIACQPSRIVPTHPKSFGGIRMNDLSYGSKASIPPRPQTQWSVKTRIPSTRSSSGS